MEGFLCANYYSKYFTYISCLILSFKSLLFYFGERAHQQSRGDRI